MSYLILRCERCNEDFYICKHIGTALDQQDHVVEFTETDWTIEHPVRCRTRTGGLLSCPLNDDVKNLGPTPPSPGRYTLNENLYNETGDLEFLEDNDA